MKEFYTRQKANEGNRIPLYHPDGTASEHWMLIRGIDSDTFRKTEVLAKRRAMEIAQIKSEEARNKAVHEEELRCIASLVADWSFEDECTEINVVNFLREAPQIADMVNRYAARRTEFFAKKSVSSVNGSDVKSPSKRSRKAPK